MRRSSETRPRSAPCWTAEAPIATPGTPDRPDDARERRTGVTKKYETHPVWYMTAHPFRRALKQRKVADVVYFAERLCPGASEQRNGCIRADIDQPIHADALFDAARPSDDQRNLHCGTVRGGQWVPLSGLPRLTGHCAFGRGSSKASTCRFPRAAVLARLCDPAPDRMAVSTFATGNRSANCGFPRFAPELRILKKSGKHGHDQT